MDKVPGIVTNSQKYWLLLTKYLLKAFNATAEFPWIQTGKYIQIQFNVCDLKDYDQ